MKNLFLCIALLAATHTGNLPGSLPRILTPWKSKQTHVPQNNHDHLAFGRALADATKHFKQHTTPVPSVENHRFKEVTKVTKMPNFLKCIDGITLVHKENEPGFSLSVFEYLGYGKESVSKKWLNPTGLGRGAELARANSFYQITGTQKFPSYFVCKGEETKCYFFGNYKNPGTVEIWIDNASVSIKKLEAKNLIIHARNNGQITIKEGSVKETIYIGAKEGTTVDLRNVDTKKVIFRKYDGVSGTIDVKPSQKFYVTGRTAELPATVRSHGDAKAPSLRNLTKNIAKRVIKRSIPQFFKRSVNILALATGIAAVTTGIVTLVGSAALGIEFLTGETIETITPPGLEVLSFSGGDKILPGGAKIDGSAITLPGGSRTLTNINLTSLSGNVTYDPTTQIYSLPDGSSFNASGWINSPRLPATIAFRDGQQILPDGSLAAGGVPKVTLANGQTLSNPLIGTYTGSITANENGVYTLPDGSTFNNQGWVEHPEINTITFQNGNQILSTAGGGTTPLTNNTIRLPNGNTLTHPYLEQYFGSTANLIIAPDANDVYTLPDGSSFNPNGWIKTPVNQLPEIKFENGNQILNSPDYGPTSLSDNSIRLPNGKALTHPYLEQYFGSTANLRIAPDTNGVYNLPDGSSFNMAGWIKEPEVLKPITFQNGNQILSSTDDSITSLNNNSIRLPNGTTITNTNLEKYFGSIEKLTIAPNENGVYTLPDGSRFNALGWITPPSRTLPQIDFEDGNQILNYNSDGSKVLNVNNLIRLPNGTQLSLNPGETIDPGYNASIIPNEQGVYTLHYNSGGMDKMRRFNLLGWID